MSPWIGQNQNIAESQKVVVFLAKFVLFFLRAVLIFGDCTRTKAFLYFLPKSIYSTELPIYSKIHSKQFCNFLLSEHFQKLCFFSLFLFELQVYYLKALICANRQTHVIKWDILLSKRERERKGKTFILFILRTFSLIFSFS